MGDHDRCLALGLSQVFPSCFPLDGDLHVRMVNAACRALAFAVLIPAALGTGVFADSLRLKNGLTYSGKVVDLREFAVYSSRNPRANKMAPPSGRIWMVDDGPHGSVSPVGKWRRSILEFRTSRVG